MTTPPLGPDETEIENVLAFPGTKGAIGRPFQEEDLIDDLLNEFSDILSDEIETALNEEEGDDLDEESEEDDFNLGHQYFYDLEDDTTHMVDHYQNPNLGKSDSRDDLYHSVFSQMNAIKEVLSKIRYYSDEMLSRKH